jgi:hypothetical protein
MSVPSRRVGGTPSARRPERSRHDPRPDFRRHDPRHPAGGSVTLEWVLVLPLVALAMAGILEVGAVVRDALLVHDAARLGARAAATSTGDADVHRAVAGVLPDARVDVQPRHRRDGDLVRVRVELTRSLGGISHRLRATAVARTEPVVGLPPPDVGPAPSDAVLPMIGRVPAPAARAPGEGPTPRRPPGPVP